jgi:hypothetical protein
MRAAARRIGDVWNSGTDFGLRQEKPSSREFFRIFPLFSGWTSELTVPKP